MKFIPKDFVSETESEFTAEQNIVAHAGQPLQAVVTSVPMVRAEAMEWIAFLIALQGKRGTFLFGDPFNIAPRGVGTGTPLIAGASQTGQDINTDGWTFNQTGILLKGDWLQVAAGSAAKIHMQLVNTNSDAGGLSTLTLWPEVRTAFPDNAIITVNSPKGLWRLQTNERPWTVKPDGLYLFSFAIKGVL